MGLGINYVIRVNHLVSLITISTTDPWYLYVTTIVQFLISKSEYNSVHGYFFYAILYTTVGLQ